MTQFKSTLAVASGLALALAACGDNDVEETDDTLVSEEDVAITSDEFDPMTRDYVLGEEAQTRRDAFDADTFRTEYDGYRDEVMSEQVQMGGDADAEDMTDEDRSEMEAASQPRDANTNMRARTNMTWGYLDRNDDGQLSVAEYAIWAIPLDPDSAAANDAGPVELTDDQINSAADSFFYYDLDGDTYLDQREFTSARRGETFDG